MNPSNNNPPAWALEAARKAVSFIENDTRMWIENGEFEPFCQRVARIIASHAPQPDAPKGGPVEQDPHIVRSCQSKLFGYSGPVEPPEHNCKPLSAQRASGNLSTPQPGPTPETDNTNDVIIFLANRLQENNLTFYQFADRVNAQLDGLRRLERERDEARRLFDATSIDLQNALIDRATYLRELNEARRDRDGLAALCEARTVALKDLIFTASKCWADTVKAKTIFNPDCVTHPIIEEAKTALALTPAEALRRKQEGKP